MAGAPPERECDVLVVGGGPAGSTVAALLAERGRDVVLVEMDRHPRFHIGESLLPLNLPLIDALGLGDEVRRIGMLKYGAELVSPQHGAPRVVEFADAWDRNFPYAYHVRRSEFDHLLLRNAAAKGVDVIEGCRIVAVDFPAGGGAIAQGRDEHGGTRRFRAKLLVDASGRDTLLANRFGIKRRNRRHASAALFGHFSGVPRPPGNAAGNIGIFWFEHGWFWLIPLADGTTSVGAVCWPAYLKSRKGDLTTFFLATIALCPALSARLAGAKLVAPATGTGNYSYRARRMAGPSYILLGDAYAFVDPIFSTGVYLAMTSAFAGAEAIERCLSEPAQASHALRRFEAEVRRGLDTFSWYIYRATSPTFRDILMAENRFNLKPALLSLLAGDVFRRTPVRSRLLLLKGLYYAWSLAHLRRSLAAWRMRRRSLRTAVHEAAPGG